MKIVKFAAFLFYRYYSTGATSRIPYFSTLCALAMIFYIHLFQFLILINYVDEVIPGGGDDIRIVKYLKMALFLAPIFVILLLTIKEKELKEMQVGSLIMKRGYVFLIAYIVISFAFLIFLILWKKDKI